MSKQHYVTLLKHSVDSSNISSMRFQECLEGQCTRLLVTFHNGDTYEYLNVPLDTYTELVNAKSVGSKFHSLIRGKFEHRKVTMVTTMRAKNA